MKLLGHVVFARLLVSCMLAPCASIAMAQTPPQGAPSVDERLRAAQHALESHDLKHAQDLLTALAAERPGDPHVLYDLGYVDEDLKDTAGAQKAYKAAVAVDPSYGEAHVALGLLMANTGAGSLTEAAAELRAGSDSAQTPPEVRAQALRALAGLELKGGAVQARADLLKAIQLTRETQEDIVLGAELAQKAGDLPGAEAAYRRALQLRPDDLAVVAGLAGVLNMEKKPAEADALLTAALAGHPGDARVLAQLAVVKVTEGQPEQAVALLESLLSPASPGPEPPIAKELAHLYVLTHQEAKAEALYRRLLSHEPNDAALLDDLGDVLVREAKFAEAEAALRQAVAQRDGFSQASDWGEAAGHLAFAASRNHDPDVTLQALAARATVLPNSAATLFLEATAYDSLKRNKDAVRMYRAFLAAANGQFPDEEFEARHRLVALEHMK